MKLLTFRKGVHPKEYKQYSEHKELERLPLPKEVFIPMLQHIGSPCKPIVEKKQEVKTGQIIGESTGYVSSTVHASISGIIKAIDTFMHPLGTPAMMIHILGNETDEWIEMAHEQTDWKALSREEIIDIILQAGIVGMGGAAFPTQVKMKPPKDKKIDTFIINGCECEPFLTADHRMMIEQTADLVLGTRIIMKALNVKQAMIGIENNKPDAINALQKATREFKQIKVVPLQVKYPQGAEKMLIQATLGPGSTDWRIAHGCRCRC
jgi:electron transport complex protein RnfC